MNKEDLLQIKEAVKEVVTQAIQEQVPPMIDKGINMALEQVVMPQFDLLHERIDKVETGLSELKQEVIGLKNQFATKGWVEDRLDNFRIDHGLTFKPAT